MTHSRILFSVTLFFILTLHNGISAQSWEFAKEKNGIRIYTRKETGKALKSYKGEAIIHASPEKIFAVLENVNQTDWWDKNLNEIQVLGYEKYKSARYYLVYDLPWPVTDRDLVVAVTASFDKATEEGKIVAVPATNSIPVRDDKIRIKEYRQIWSVKPSGNGSSHIVLEGFVDPSGHIPDWIVNSVIVDSPFKIIKNVKEKVEGK